MEYSFNVDLAVEIGINEAIFVKNMQFWLRKNQANEKHIKEGRTWTYNSRSAFSKLFPFWSPDQIKRLIKRLVEKGILLIKQWNRSKYDQTNWYAFVDEERFLGQKTTSESESCSDRVDEIAHSGLGEIAHSSLYTDNKPNNKTILSSSVETPSSTTSLINEIFEYWKEVMNHPKAKLDNARKNHIGRALKLGYNKFDCFLAIRGCKESKWHMGENADKRRYDDLGLIFRNSEKIDKFMSLTAYHNPLSSSSTWEDAFNMIKRGEAVGIVNIMKQRLSEKLPNDQILDKHKAEKAFKQIFNQTIEEYGNARS